VVFDRSKELNQYMCPLPLPFPGGSTGQVWSGRGDPTGCAQRDGHHVLVAAPG
jgi:hypothetical protein